MVTMCEESNHVCFCPLSGIIETIGKKWALLAINALGDRGKLRFNQLMEDLKGISPKTLADILKELQKEGLIKRDAFAEVPPKVEYSLTEDGVELRKAIIPLLEWAASRERFVEKGCVASYRKMPAHRIYHFNPANRN